MIRYLVDENFNGDIARGMVRRRPDLDLVRVQDVGLGNTDDRAILDWAAAQGRILLTHDRATTPNFAYHRLVNHQPMAGVFVVNDRMPIGEAIDELLLIDECSEPDEWNNHIIYLPL